MADQVPTEIRRVIQMTVDKASQLLLSRKVQTTCPVHEWCNGTCEAIITSGRSPIQLNPLHPKIYEFGITPPQDMDFPEPSPLTEPTIIESDELNSFKYTPLESAGASIRLIHVEPGVFLEDVVSIALFEVPLDSTPAYTALSYCWGEPAFEHDIICNGQLLHITKSLYDALRRHRQHRFEEPQLVWADAICIDQSNRFELNHQIPLMDRIYSGADRVYIDLGDTDPGFFKGVDLMNRVNVLSQQMGIPPHLVSLDNLDAFGLPPMEYAWNDLSRPFLSAWFMRTWTIQEAVLAKDIWLRLGRHTFRWESFENSWEFLKRANIAFSPNDDEDSILAKLNFIRIIKIRHGYQDLGEHKPEKQGHFMFGPVNILSTTREFYVSNDKDRIVGILGMFPYPKAADSDFKFFPDYSGSTGDVYHAFASYLVKNGSILWGKEESIRMLSYAGLERRSEDANLPSWVPDWRAQTVRKHAKPLFQMRMIPYAAAPRDYTASTFVPGENPGLLMIQGWITDTIFTLGDELPDYETYTEWLEWHDSSYHVFEEAVTSDFMIYDNPMDAFCQTLLVGDLNTGENAVSNTSAITDAVECHDMAISGLRAKRGKLFGERAGQMVMGQMDRLGTYISQAQVATVARRLAITEQGYVGLVPMCTQLGDRICIFAGASVPFAVREVDDGVFQLVGEAYIHGVMEGEKQDLGEQTSIMLQ